MYRRQPPFSPLIILCLVGVLASSVSAKPKLMDNLGTARPLPSKLKRVSYVPEQRLDRRDLKPEKILRDPSTLVRFLKTNPDQRSVANLNRSMVLTFVSILVEGQALIMAEDLLRQAVVKWSTDAALKLAYGRLLIDLGRMDAATDFLREAVQAAPTQADSNFLYAFALVLKRPPTTENKQLAIKHFEETLRLSPNFQDKSGWTARNIRNQLTRMRAELKTPAKPTAGP